MNIDQQLTGVSESEALFQRSCTSWWLLSSKFSFPFINVCTTLINASSCLFDIADWSAISAKVYSACEWKGNHGFWLRMGGSIMKSVFPKSSKESTRVGHPLLGWYSVRMSSV